jgi:hypothetical protein
VISGALFLSIVGRFWFIYANLGKYAAAEDAMTKEVFDVVLDDIHMSNSDATSSLQRKEQN